MGEKQEGLFISLKDASDILKTSKGEIYKLIHEGKVSTIRENNRIFINSNDLRRIKTIRKISLKVTPITKSLYAVFRILIKLLLWIIFIAGIPTAGIFYQAIVSRPYITIEEIGPADQPIFEQKIYIKNSGQTECKHMEVSFNKILGINLQPKGGTATYYFEPGAKIKTKADIQGINLTPDQKTYFNISDFFNFDKANLKVNVKTSFTIQFEYRDFLTYIPYSNEITVEKIKVGSEPTWKIVGEKSSGWHNLYIRMSKWKEKTKKTKK